MQSRFTGFINRIIAAPPRSPVATTLLAIFGIGAVGIADYHIGPRIHLSIFYFIPILHVSWFVGLRYGVLCSVVAAGCWFGVELAQSHGSYLAESLWNSLGRLVIFLSVAWMVDRLHRIARDQLREAEVKSNMRIMNILESISDAFFAVDKQWRFTYFNRKAEEFLTKLNKQKEGVLGKVLWEEFPDTSGGIGRRLLSRAMAEQEPVSYETFYEPLGVWVEIRAYPFADGLSVSVRDITDRKRSEEGLRTQYNEIASMHRLSSVLVLSPRLRWRLGAGVHAVLEETGFDAGCAFLVDTDQDRVVLKYAEGYPEEILASMREFRIGEGITGSVAKEGVARYVEGASHEATQAERAANLGGGFASIPLTSKGKVIGVLNLTSRTPYAFTVQRRSMLETFGNQIGIAIESAQLYETARERAQKIRELSLDLTQIQEEERRYFARELHDGLSQTLTTLKLNAELSLQHLNGDNETGKKFLKEVIELADEAQAEAKEIAHDLRPSVLDDFGLKSALSLLAKKFERRTGITTDLTMQSVNDRYETLIESTVYRIVQELLANVAKHSGASGVTITIFTENSTMHIVIADNGKGMPANLNYSSDAAFGGRGLRNIRERLEVLGGKVRFDSAAGRGTKVSVDIPLTP